MSQYPALTKLMEENYFQENQQVQMEVGFKLLEYMLFNICFLKLKDPKCYRQIKQRMPQIIIKELKISDKQHLGMCLGGISENKKYQVLNKIEDQLQTIIKYNQKSKIISRPYPESSLSRTFDDSKSSFYGYEISGLQNKNSQILNNITQSSIKKRGNQIEETSFYINFQQNQSSCYPPSPDVQAYLKEKVQYKNSQLSYVNQLLTLNLQWEQYQQEKYSKKFIAKGKIIVSGLYTKEGDVQIKGQGSALKKQTAKEQASTVILRRLYESYPYIFIKIIQQKKKKGLNY